MVKGDRYAIKLYELARCFWPNSVELDLSLNELTKIQTPGRLSNTCGTGSDGHVEVPATYLGGNPFVLTRQGTATWPIWVPDIYAPEKLTQARPPRSTRASTIYLGWALHILHDLSHPYHAMNKVGPFHGCLEKDLDDWIQAGKFEHLPVLTPLKGVPKYQYSNKTVYWPDFYGEFSIGPYDHCRKYSDMEMPHRFAEVIRAAKLSFEEIRVGCIHSLKNQLEILKVKLNTPLPGLTLQQRMMLETEIRTTEMKIKEVEKKSLAASEYLMDVALKNTIMMITCLRRDAGYTGYIKNKFHKPVEGANITFLSKDGKITKSTRSQRGGLYLVSLPKLGVYDIHVTIPNYNYRPTRPAILEKGGFYSYDIVLPISQ